MRATILTVRIDEKLRAALDRQAKAEGKSVSEVVRQILERAVSEQPQRERTGHLRGRLRLPPADSGWRERLRERNWRS